MKFYISADIEGISGVVDSSFTTREGYNYNTARILMTEEVNAAITGVQNTGEHFVLVNDSHGPMTNIDILRLDKRSNLICGNKKIDGMMEGLDSTFDGVIFIGYHCRSNTDGTLSHTHHSRVVLKMSVNNVEVGEFEMNSLYAYSMGVPVIFASGDDKFLMQVEEFNSSIKTVCTKDFITRLCSNNRHPDTVRADIARTLANVLEENLDEFQIQKASGEFTLEMQFMNSGMADICKLIPGVIKMAPNIVRFQSEKFEDIYRTRIALTILANTML